MMKKTKTTTIQSLERDLIILDIIGKAVRPLLLNEIAEHFTIDRSSVFRLIGHGESLRRRTISG